MSHKILIDDFSQLATIEVDALSEPAQASAEKFYIKKLETAPAELLGMIPRGTTELINPGGWVWVNVMVPSPHARQSVREALTQP